MKSLGEDWFAVGEVHFRSLHCISMVWGHGFSFSQFKIAAGEYSGYIAAGRLVSQHLWKDAPPVALGWSVSEELVIVQKTGFTSVLDLSGNYVRRFSMGQEAEQREIVAVKFFTMHNHTGLAVLTGGNHIFVTASIETPHMRRLAEFPGPSQPPTCWLMVPGPLSFGQPSKSGIDGLNGPWALIAKKKLLFRADYANVDSVDLSSLIPQVNVQIQHFGISPNMKFVSVYLENGLLLITNLRMSELLLQVDLTQRISTAPNEDDPNKAQTILAPLAMFWCTGSAVVLHWHHLVALVGSQGDVYEYFFQDDVWLTQEFDGVRILTPTSHEFLQRVPPALEALGRIGASCPATWLLSASTNLKLGSGRTNDYLMPIKDARQMSEAISHCIEAACHASFDPDCQKSLLEAANMGRIFMSAMFMDKELSIDKKVKELAERTASVCRTLRLLNNLAAPWIGVALTWREFQVLGTKRLLDRLLARKHYPMAVEFIRLGIEESSSAETAAHHRDKRLTELLTHWACHSTTGASENSTFIGERLSEILRTIRCALETAATDGSRPKSFCPDTLGSVARINFAQVASEALVAGREKVAEQLLEYEPRAWQQVPLLIKLGRFDRALVRAVETGNPELITVVVAALQDQAKLPPADLAMVLRRHPIAMAIYQETWGQSTNSAGALDSESGGSLSLTQTALLSFNHEDDRASEAKKAVLAAHKETECNAAVRLLRFQNKLQKQQVRAPVLELAPIANTADASLGVGPLIVPTTVSCIGEASELKWVGEPLNITMARLLAVPQGERWAEQLKREFRVSEKRYAHFRLIGLAIQNDCWREIEKMSKMSKPPVHTETLIKICIDGNHFEEAQKMIPQLPSERRVRFWLLCGQVEEAIQTAVREHSDKDLCLIQEHIGKSNRTTYERLTALRQQIR
ncbi:Vacuolar protein sorting-associated protein 16 protein [Fasciola gigantica]|uniref:Vacuolar protein sorting-associated protein 16 homolog n=1 Tax=Fasciola gigantica TaxID=46835 RepID=A0A504YZK4_FASGI|nr:Vacuolar protein sorting-associated protein 16 protein [Fasciola gigantica]